jgi:hypothetical protein
MTTTSADIQRYEVSTEGNIHYFIKVVYNGREWAVRKRYSDFSRLDEFLQKDGFKLSYALPSKQFWNKYDKKALAARQKGLQSYLNTLLTNTVSSDNSLVKEFLEVDHNRLQQARKQSFHAFKRTERLESLVSIMNRMVIPIPAVKNARLVQQPLPPKEVQSAPVTRERHGSNSSVGSHSFSASGPYMQKSKSLSFSMKFSFSGGSPRKNSFQPDSRQSFATVERKQSLEMHAPSHSNKSSSVDVSTLKDLLKKEAYEYGVSALFPMYEAELLGILAELDVKPPPKPVGSPAASGSASGSVGSAKQLPRSYYRRNSGTSASTPTSAASQRRHSVTEIIPHMSRPVPVVGDDPAMEGFLDTRLSLIKRISPVPFLGIAEMSPKNGSGVLAPGTPTRFLSIPEERDSDPARVDSDENRLAKPRKGGLRRFQPDREDSAESDVTPVTPASVAAPLTQVSPVEKIAQRSGSTDGSSADDGPRANSGLRVNTSVPTGRSYSPSPGRPAVSFVDEEDQRLTREAAEYVALQQKYNVLVYLVDER